MVDIIFTIKYTLYRIVYFTIHSILAFYYRGEKQTVPPIKNSLLLKSACQLAEEIREGKIKSEEVVQAYIERISEVKPYINAVAEDRFREALEEAKKVDRKVYEITHSENISKQQLAEEKPFLGVPFTFKLFFKVKDLPCTAGCKLFENQISTEDAPCVDLIKKAGGIILATTNTPEFGFSLECSNPLYGRTRNPYDTTRTCGASSGGEGALLGAGASVVGIGNDLAGSVRLPAHFNGVFSHKPSMGLVNSSGCFPIPNRALEPYVYSGPMCRYSEDLVPLMKVLSEQKSVAQKFGQKVNFRKLKIYYSTHIKDPKMPPIDKEIVSSIHKAISHFTENYNVLAKEVNIPLLYKSTEFTLYILTTPVRKLIDFVTLGKVDVNYPLELLKFLFGKSIFSWPLLFYHMTNLYPYFLIHKNSSTYYNALLEKVKNELDEILDENSVFIYPTYPVVAPYHYEMSTSTVLTTAYTGIFNLTGHPATQCPLGFNKEGLPYGMQIIGGMNNDPLTVACAVELEKVLGGWTEPK